MNAPLLRIRLFGALDLRLGDTSLPPVGARLGSLLAYLLLRRDAPQPRQHVAFLLWPESTEAQARTNLRHALHDLRRVIPGADTWLAVTPRTLQWRSAAPCWIDVVAFDDVCARAERTAADDAVALLRESVALYRGDLLEGCYDAWLEGERAVRRARFIGALERLATAHATRGDGVEAIAVLERLVAVDPLRESAYRQLMRLHADRGDRARALRAYQQCATVVARELDTLPAAETRLLHDTLLGAEAGRSASSAGAQRQPPLVGRVREWERVTDLWREAARGRVRLLLVTGEPGIGKSRLVEELASWCGARDAGVALARSYAAEGGLAYAPLAAWLRSDALRGPVAAIDDARRAELSRILPELHAGLPSQRQPASLPEGEQRQRLFDAAAHAIAAAAKPLLLVADDLHWCDEETLRFLHYLVRAAQGSPLLIAGTARTEELPRRQALRELVVALRALGHVESLELERLSAGGTADLARSLAPQSLEETETDALFRETEGNPLFVVEAVRAGRRPASAGGAAVPPKVHAVIEWRLEQLSPAARDLAGVAATLGREFAFELLARASGADADVVVSGVDELWRSGIVRPLGPDAYDFSHDRIRDVAYAVLGPARRRENHLRAAHALKQLHADQRAQVAGRIAFHYDEAGVAAEAATWYEAAAEIAQRVCASAEAIRLLDRALALVRTLPAAQPRSARELAILTALLAPVASIHGFLSDAMRECQSGALALARTLGVEAPPPVLRSLAIAALSRDDFDAAREHGEQLLARAQADGDALLLMEADYVLGIAAFWHGRLHAARTHFERAAAGHPGDHRGEHLVRYGLDPQVVCASRLANTLYYLGEVQEAERACDRALQLAEGIGHPNTRAIALVFAGLHALELEDRERLRACIRALDAERHDSLQGLLGADMLRGYQQVLDGDPAGGIATIRAHLDGPGGARHAPGMRGFFTRVLLAAYAAAGDVRGILDAADHVLGLGRSARIWAAEAHRMRAECLTRLGAPAAEIEAALDCAASAAREQGARLFEERLTRLRARRARPSRAAPPAPMSGQGPGRP